MRRSPPAQPTPPSPIRPPRCRFSPLRHDPRRLYRSPPPVPAPVRAPMAPPVTDPEPPPGPSSLRARRGRSRRAPTPPRPRHQRQRRRGQWGQSCGAGTRSGHAPYSNEEGGEKLLPRGMMGGVGGWGFGVRCACAMGNTVARGWGAWKVVRVRAGNYGNHGDAARVVRMRAWEHGSFVMRIWNYGSCVRCGLGITVSVLNVH